jgi:hypothetical protein
MMNQDPQLTELLNQHRSIDRLDPTELEERLIAKIEPPDPNQKRNSRTWRRYVEIAVGTISMGIVGATIHQFMNPSQARITANRLDRYLESHWHNLMLDLGENNDRDMSELDFYLLQTDDTPQIPSK